MEDSAVHRVMTWENITDDLSRRRYDISEEESRKQIAHLVAAIITFEKAGPLLGMLLKSQVETIEWALGVSPKTGNITQDILKGVAVLTDKKLLRELKAASRALREASKDMDELVK